MDDDELSTAESPGLVRAESPSSSEDNDTFLALRIEDIQDISSEITIHAVGKFSHYCSGLMSGSISAQEVVEQTRKEMSKNHISRDIHFYGHTIKDGDGSQPLIVRPPVDDLIFFKHIKNSRIPIQGVIGAAAAEPFYNHVDWVPCPATIHLQGTSVPAHIMNGEVCAEIEDSTSQRRVPHSYDFNKYTTVFDVINIVELGNATDLPALLWSTKSRRSKGWSSKDNDNFINLMKIYIHIHDNKNDLTSNSKVERTKWRSMVTGSTAEYFTTANEKHSTLSLSKHYKLV